MYLKIFLVTRTKPVLLEGNPALVYSFRDIIIKLC